MRLLFICTHNRCRSILAEAISNHRAGATGKRRIEARSAGSQPAGEVHPLSIVYLNAHGIATEGLRSQSWDAFEHWSPDVVITVCDSAAGEQCPAWFGDAILVHWGLGDPSKIAERCSDKTAVASAFNHTITTIEARITALLSEPFETYNNTQLAALFEQLESIDGTV